MRRQLTRTILAVTALVLVVLGVPLAIAVRKSYYDSATVRLQRQATEGLLEVQLPLDRNQPTSQDGDGNADPVTVYDPTGQRLTGPGPVVGDAAVSQALGGDSASNSNDRELIVALPITERGSEDVAGVLRVTEPLAAVDAEVHRAWVVMALTSLGALVLAWLVASALSRRLARPIQRLAEAATRFGDGAVVIPSEPSGVREIDQLDAALAASSSRLALLLSRERSFSADVSHQLRTPLTRLRMSLEALDSSGVATVDALADVDHLQATVERLLALSRDRQPVGEPVDVNEAVMATSRRWTSRIEQTGRTLQLATTEGLPLISGSQAALDQVLDVLIDNAIIHGSGTVDVASRAAPGGVVIEVTDEGSTIEPGTREAIFDRHHGTGNGIGLALARALAESEGGRLLLTDVNPTRFTLIFPR